MMVMVMVYRKLKFICIIYTIALSIFNFKRRIPTFKIMQAWHFTFQLKTIHACTRACIPILRHHEVKHLYTCVAVHLYIYTYMYLGLQIGATPDHVPLDRHWRVLTALKVNPASQLYVAMPPTKVVEIVTVPPYGALRGPQSTAILCHERWLCKSRSIGE